MNRNVLVGFASSLVLLAFSGCGGGSDHPPVYPVMGTVLYKGDPVADAVVTFHGEDATKMATGRTDAQGRFTLTTYEPGDGAAAGTHHVTVTKMTTTGGGGESGSMEEAAAAASDYRPAEEMNELPSKYADPGLSQLEYPVTKEGPNEFKIELND